MSVYIDNARHPYQHLGMSSFRRMIMCHMIADTLDELQIPYHVVGGSMQERLEKIVSIFEMPVVRPVDEAVEMAKARVTEGIEILQADQRYHDAQRRKSTWRRIKYALRY